MRAGGVFNWPDTFPLFSRDELRDLLGDALHISRCPEHLAGWRRIIDPGNKAKNQIGSYSRRFRLQHYWRLLRQRHPHVFHRRQNRVDGAFADFFSIAESTIARDRGQIEESFGPDWDERGISA